MKDWRIVATPAQFLKGENPGQPGRVVGHLEAWPCLFRMGEHDTRVALCAAEYLKQIEQLHALAVQARDARTSAERRTALDALERAALALGEG